MKTRLTKKEVEKTQTATQKLERDLKILIFLCALHLIAKSLLFFKINKLLSKYNKELPQNLIDRQHYIEGAYTSAKKMVSTAYDTIVYNFETSIDLEYETPYDCIETYLKRPEVLIAEPQVKNYGNIIMQTFEHLDKQQLVYSEDGKRPITLWQKVELDLRHADQMEKVDKAYASGNDLWWLSSHANCSKRCEPWQGKLVSLTLPPIDDSFFTGKMEGREKVYSFTAIENVVDKWGYKNNIINGFNCRHSLIKYVKGEPKPKKYFDKELSRVRELENEQRSIERKLRKLNSRYKLLKTIDEMKAWKVLQEYMQLEKRYKAFCKRYNLPYEYYRIF